MVPTPTKPIFTAHTLKSLLKRTLRLFIITYVAIVAILYFQQDAMLFPRPLERSPFPQVSGLTAATVTTSDGETLPALYLPAKENNPTILFFHGNGDQINTFAFLAEAFGKQGFGYASVEYRGYPGATGSVSEQGLMTDGLAAFDWLKSTCQCEIVLMGHSLGTGVAVHVAAEREARALALFAPYSAIVDVAAARFWYVPVRALIRNPIQSDSRIGNVTEPILMVHGKEDTVIPIRFGERLFELANDPKQFIPLDHVGHNEVLTGSVEQVTTWLAQ